MSISANLSIFMASSNGFAPMPTSGPGLPDCEVVKNTGSNPWKSFSACMRSINTEPTMPRQPTKPTLNIANLTPLIKPADSCKTV